MGKNKFLVFTEFGELLDLGMELARKDEVVFHVDDPSYRKIGEGILNQSPDNSKHWWRRMGQGYTWIFDGCSNGKLQDWLREKGENVFGGCEAGDKLENDRQLNQKWFKSLGYKISPSKNFKGPTAFDDAIKFLKEKSRAI